ncbi:hypothetical protein [Archaeoglobus sp.]
MKIRKAVINAVESVVEFYNEKSERFKDIEKWDYPFILWSESDFRTRLAHELISELGEGYYVHTEFPLKQRMFHKDPLGDKWDNAVNTLLKMKNGKMRAGDIDLLITGENDSLPFLMCMEVKYIHYDPKKFGVLPQHLKEQLEVLRVLKGHGVTEDILYVYVDRRRESNVREVLEMLKGEEVVCYCMDDAMRLVRLK